MALEGNLFVNKISKPINNNEIIYYSKESNVPNEHLDIKSIYQKINGIFTSRNYIYKADVIIKINSGEYKKRIIGRNKNYLITSDNELISISDILDIKMQ